MVGSDLASNAASLRLPELSANVKLGHAAEHIVGANAVVTSTAVNEANPEVVAARAAKVPVVPRAIMLAELMRLKRGIPGLNSRELNKEIWEAWDWGATYYITKPFDPDELLDVVARLLPGSR